jgi:cobalt-precorrin-5B (C1)-methyltransferase
MNAKSLQYGFTTGACAAAAAKGAALMLREQCLLQQVELWLPAGFAANFRLGGQRFTETSAICFVVKDAGDDPDVTHGVEVHAEVFLVDAPSSRTSPTIPSIVIEGGIGIGRVTKPGLAVPVGEWAINPVPRRMITEAVQEALPPYSSLLTPHVIISIPDGVERARRTLNERLGIIGGLSILGTSGVVRPVSHQAWTDTIDVALDVAVAAGAPAVVLSTGRTSEIAAQRELPWPVEAFIMMGDHVEHALTACHRRGIPAIILAAQFAKLVKIGCGYPHTHAGRSQLDLRRLGSWVRGCGLDEGLAKQIECAHTAREAFEMGNSSLLAEIVAGEALTQMRNRAPGAKVGVLLVGYEADITWQFGEWPDKEGIP